MTDEKAVAQILADAFEYGDDCSSKHSATWKSIDDAKAKAKQFNEQQGTTQP